MSKILYISDTHFCSDRKFGEDRFSSHQERDAYIIKQWNHVVASEDHIYILGDFCEGPLSNWEKIVPQLPGHKHLIRGNHEFQEMPATAIPFFDSVKDYDEILDGDVRVILCHYPLLLYTHASAENFIHLCGHVHLTRENEHLERWRQELRSIRKETGDPLSNRGQIYNVGCMCPWMDYQPRTLETIRHTCPLI